MCSVLISMLVCKFTKCTPVLYCTVLYYFTVCVCYFVGQVQSQEELIGVLSQQLREARQEKASLQLEFNQYRKHSQVRQIKP